LMSNYTSLDSIPQIVSSVQKSFYEGITKSLQFRKVQLQRLCQCFIENEKKFSEALISDLGMSKMLQMTESFLTIKECENAIANLDKWAKPEKADVPISQFPGKAYIYKEPLGVVLIIGPFNYPITCITRPMIGAIAAGNTIIVKPSEVSTAVQNLFVELLPKYLDNRCYKLVIGSVAETTELLKQKFDHIIYTGNGSVGKIIMKAAAENLTPVTLELGGKSPCIVDKEIDIDIATARICWGKFLNNGQTCIGVDYVLVNKDIEAPFIEGMKKSIKNFFGENPKNNLDFGKIINQRHFKRILDLMSGGKIVFGGEFDPESLYIAPTILTEVNLDSPLMKDEIFGPLLPVITYNRIEEAIKFINDRPKPLALYIFTKNNSLAEKVLNNTSSGGSCVNETVMHNTCNALPFGGVGESGMGVYNGKWSFDTFTHKKAVLKKSLSFDPSIRFPPYTDNKIKWVKRLSSINLPSIKMKYAMALLSVIFAYFQREMIKKYINNVI